MTSPHDIIGTVLGEKTDRFDVLMDLAESTLMEGKTTVEANRLARGVMALAAYIDEQLLLVRKLEAVVEEGRKWLAAADYYNKVKGSEGHVSVKLAYINEREDFRRAVQTLSQGGQGK
jgi:hypothetical protein